MKRTRGNISPWCHSTVANEELMVARAAEVPVPDAVLLIAVRRADARIQIEANTIAWATFRNVADPMAGQVGKRSEVLRSRQPVRFESAHLAR